MKFVSFDVIGYLTYDYIAHLDASILVARRARLGVRLLAPNHVLMGGAMFVRSSVLSDSTMFVMDLVHCDSIIFCVRNSILYSYILGKILRFQKRYMAILWIIGI